MENNEKGQLLLTKVVKRSPISFLDKANNLNNATDLLRVLTQGQVKSDRPREDFKICSKNS